MNPALVLILAAPLIGAAVGWLVWELVHHRDRPAACDRLGHDWFPGLGGREYVPMVDQCFRCGERRATLPYGQCLGGHPLADHYDVDGHPVQLDTCPGPQ